MPCPKPTLASVSGPQGLAGSDPPQGLADRVHAIWAQFAQDGSLPWPEFTEDSRLVYQLERGEAVAEPPMPAKAFLP